MNRYEKFIYENERGQSIEFSLSSPFFVTDITGIDGLNNTIYKSKGINQDGETSIGSTLDARNIVIEGTINSDKDFNRSQLLKILNPKLDGTLTYKNNDIEVYVKCEVEKAPFITKENKPKFITSLYSPNPFWKNTMINGTEIQTLIGGKLWPFSFPVRFATRGEPLKNIINDGHVDTPVEIIFKGPAVNPKITNKSTGEFIRIKRSLELGDTLIINTEFGNKKVEIQRVSGIVENASNYISLDSTFFQLQVGDNIIEYSTENNFEPQSVTIKYRNRYLGV